MKRHQVVDYNHWKSKGNEIFTSVYNDVSLSPVIYKTRMSQALQFYNKALTLCLDDGSKASIWKNMAATQFRIGKRLHGALLWKVTSEGRIDEIQFFLEESLGSFSKSLLAGQNSKDSKWRNQVQEKGAECIQLVWQFMVDNPRYQRHENEAQLIGRLFQLCRKTEGFIRGKLFLSLGCFCLQKAIVYQVGVEHKRALQLLKDNYTAIEEAKQHLGPSAEVTDLEDSTLIHLSIGESALARERGESNWTRATQDNEHLDMEGVWVAVDDYCQAIILTRNKCLESEAISHFRLGQLYDALLVTDKSREHFKAAVDLAQAMQPRRFNGVDWYEKSLNGLQKFQDQQRWKERKEQEKIRAPIKEKLKPVLQALRAASNESPDALLKLAYSRHPPKRGALSTDSHLKARLKKALLHYHPDKQDVDAHGLEWVVLAEQITLNLTYHYERTKGV